MNITELLEKQAKGEDLTAEELEFITFFKESVNRVAEENNKKALEEIQALKSQVEEKSSLEKTIEELREKYQTSETEAERIKKEKEELEKKITEEATKIEDLRANIRKSEEEKKEKALKLQKEEQEAKIKAQREELENRIKQMEEQLNIQAELNKINEFKQEILAEKSKRPYIESELEKILSEIEVNGLEKSKMLYNFILETKNHEQEMDLYRKKKEAGTSILKTNEVKGEVKDSFEEFLKRNKKIK